MLSSQHSERGFKSDERTGNTRRMDSCRRLGTQQQLFCSPESGCSRTVYRRGFPAKDKQASCTGYLDHPFGK